MLRSVALLALLLGCSTAKVFFQETFDTDPFADDRWVVSDWKQDSGEAGELEYSGGLWGADGRNGLRTAEDAKFYAFSTKFPEFDNSDSTLVFGFRVKHEQKMDCGGGYAKLLPPGTDQQNFNGENEYAIMFGPDICGYSTKKVQAIFGFNGENLLKSSDVTAPDDEYTHTYVLVLNADDTYDILVDGESEDSGDLKDAWPFETSQTIKDPEDTKPEDWVDDKMIDDPTDEKPEGYDDISATVVDPDAAKPDDWDDEEDGEWEAPMIDNPDYQGPWRAQRIENPDYVGPWEQKEIDNPDYVEYADVYKRGAIGVIGVEVWQVKSGTVFSDFIVADSLDDVNTFFENQAVDIEAEKEAKTAYDEAQAEAAAEAEDEDEEESEFEEGDDEDAGDDDEGDDEDAKEEL